MKVCSIDDCERPSRKRGWCEGHYYHYKTKGTPYGPRKRKQAVVCADHGCDRAPLAKDLCRTHYYKLYWEARGGIPKPPRQPKRVYQYNSISEALSKPAEQCPVNDCTNKVINRGLCGKHYQRWRRFGDPTFHPPEMERHCSVAGCTRVSNARKLCAAHYRRWQLYGDPLVTKHRSHVPREGESVCVIEGCARRSTSPISMCSLHYGRKVRHGDPTVQSVPCVKVCIVCEREFDPGAGRARKYCGKKCKPSGRIAGSVNKRNWVEKIGDEDGWECRLCDKPIDRFLYWPNPQAGSVDHKLPVSHGGTDERSNLWLAHVTCNSMRSNRLL